MPLLLLIFLFIVFSGAVQAQQPIPRGFASAQVYTVEVLNTYPHDATAFTQGLLWHDGSLYESTGQRGESTLREVDLTTGEVLRSVPVTRGEEALNSDNPPIEYFAEGLELVNGQLIQLTWQAGEAFIYDPATFEQVGSYTYEGEGWGLCQSGDYIYMSDSTQYLSIREADTFELVARQLVTLNGSSLNTGLLNELECVGDSVYANLWQTDYIAQIDKYTGNIVTMIDASGLLTDEMKQEIPGTTTTEDGVVVAPSGAVLNGIAYNPETDTFYITGKDWPRLFEVQFVPASSAEAAG
ncbi:MAG: glutaminyl-peptide cyclotransferase [Anaerolineae bacterium]|nr:glutaminyl-peptide cyclotransferase [Anaerolineae bacterium]